MKKDSFGVWEITIPPISHGVCAIPHDSKIKVLKVFVGVLLVVLNHMLLDFNGSSIGTTN
jgi:hypothetical protein